MFLRLHLSVVTCALVALATCCSSNGQGTDVIIDQDAIRIQNEISLAIIPSITPGTPTRSG